MFVLDFNFSVSYYLILKIYRNCTIPEYTRPKYWYTKVLKENFIFSNCEDVISRFQEIITVYEEAVSGKKIHINNYCLFFHVSF